MDTCRAFRRPLADTGFNVALTIATAVVYLPQYRRIVTLNSSVGVSPYYALFHAIVSTQQFASTLIIYSTPRSIIDCLRNKHLRGLDALGALLGLVQSFVQWLCAIVLLLVVLRYYSSINQDSGFVVGPKRFLWILLSYTLVSLAPAVWILLIPNATKNIGPPAFFCGWTVIFFAPLSTLFVIFQAISEILTIWRLRSPFSLSVASLVGQSIIFVLLAVSWSFRLRPGMAKHAPGTLLGWYQYGGWIVTNYGGTAVVNLALLLVLGYMAIGGVEQESGEHGDRAPLLSTNGVNV